MRTPQPENIGSAIRRSRTGAPAVEGNRSRPEQVPLVRGQAGAGPLLPVEPDRVAAAGRAPRTARAPSRPPRRPPACAPSAQRRRPARTAALSAAAPAPRSPAPPRAPPAARVGGPRRPAHPRASPSSPGSRGRAASGAGTRQAVAVEVAVAADPLERGLHLRAQLPEQVKAARPVGVVGDQTEPQGRGVRAAVVAGEGRLAQRRRLSHAQLVQHLARVLVARVVDTRPSRSPSRRTVSAATSGTKASVCMAAMTLSRPNSVANQGTPAAK